MHWFWCMFCNAFWVLYQLPFLYKFTPKYLKLVTISNYSLYKKKSYVVCIVLFSKISIFVLLTLIFNFHFNSSFLYHLTLVAMVMMQIELGHLHKGSEKVWAQLRWIYLADLCLYFQEYHWNYMYKVLADYLQLLVRCSFAKKTCYIISFL